MKLRWHNSIEKALWRILISIILYAGAMLAGCKNKVQNQTPVADSTVYYPINNYIRQQIKAVDTTPYYLYYLRIANNRKDSATISRPVFDSLIRRFILPELETGALKKNFTESVYEDESTSSFTLTYMPKINTSVVQSAMVLLDTATQHVKWIFINTLQNTGDSTVIQKIGWKGDASCYLNRSVSYANGKKNEMHLNLVWNDK